MTDRDRFTLLSELAAADPAFAVLGSGPSFMPVTVAPLSTETLVRYFAGALPAADARGVELSLTKSPEGRAQARDARRQLERLQRTPIAELRSLAAANEPDSIIAGIWLTITQEHFNTLGSVLRGREAEQSKISVNLDKSATDLSQSSSLDIWSSIAILRERGRREAQVLEASLRAIAMQVRYAMQRSSPALARGRAPAYLSFRGAQGLPLEVEAFCEMLTCYIDAAGELNCEIQLRYRDGSPLTNYDGLSARLFLISGGMSIAIGTAVLAKGRAEWTVNEIGDLLGIIDAPLSARFLSVAVVRKSVETDGRATEPSSQSLGDLNAQDVVFASTYIGHNDGNERTTLYAPILDEAERETEAMPVEVIVAPVEWEDGALTLTVTLPAITRAAYPDHLVSIDLVAGQYQWQRLGMWPVASFTEMANGLLIPLPEIAAPSVLPCEWVRFQLRTSPVKS